MQRTLIRSARTGNAITIRAPSAVPLPESPDFDRFHRAAALFLRDLLPNSRVVLTYYNHCDDALAPPALDGPPEDDRSGSGVTGSATTVPGGDGTWTRSIAVCLEPAASGFLTHKRSDVSSRDEVIMAALPAEYDYLLAFALDAADVANAAVDPEAPPDIAQSIEAEMSLSIVAHLVALHVAPKSPPGSTTHRCITDVVSAAIRYLRDLAATRVEHSALSHAVVVTGRMQRRARGSADPYPACVATLKRSALLSDGTSAVLVLDRDGYPVRIFWHTAASRTRREREDPPELRTLLAASRQFAGAGLLLRTDGSIVIAARGRPLVLNRGGVWRALLWRTVESGLRRELGDDLGGLLAAVALQHSLRGTGCLVGVVEMTDDLPLKDRVATARASDPTDDEPAAWLWHRLLPTCSALELGVDALWTMSSIDGATLISPHGELLSYGAVVQAGSSPSEGARTAAAHQLSRHGLVIKVSADGPISVWRHEKEIVEI